MLKSYKSMKHVFRLVASALPIVAAALVLMQLLVSNALAGGGRNTQSLDLTIETIRAENELLRQQLATETSLKIIEAKAKESGFVSTVSTVTLAPPDVAYNRPQ